MTQLILAGRTVVVTGGGSGIGRATALAAARSGARVLVVDMSAEAATAVGEEIRATGAQGLALQVDVRDAGAVEAAFDRAESELGPIYGLVASAGVGGASAADTMPAETWARVIDTNLTGLFHCVQSAGRRMIGRGTGSVVAIGSTSGLGGTPQRAHYCASKFGVNGLVQALAVEWGPRGVRVNCVAPGPVDTPLLRRSWSQQKLERVYLDRIPLGRLSQPEDQANAALFLLSDAAAYITGVILPVNGGLTAGYATMYSAADL